MRQCASHLGWVYSASHGGARHHLFSELSEGDSAVLVLVHFLDDLGGLLLTDVEATRLDQALELFASDPAVVVHVEGVECLVDVEVGLALEALSDGLSGDLTAEVLAEDGAELELGVGEEAVVAAVKRVAVIGATALGHASVVSIKGEQGVAELAHVEAAVTSCIVAGDEEVELLAGGEDTDCGKTLTKISDSDTAEVVHIEDLKSISEVEIGLQS